MPTKFLRTLCLALVTGAVLGGSVMLAGCGKKEPAPKSVAPASSTTGGGKEGSSQYVKAPGRRSVPGTDKGEGETGRR